MWDEKKSVHEHIRIVASDHLKNEVLAYLYENGYRVQRSGPYSDSSMWPRVDPTRFLALGERPIDYPG